MYFDTGRLLLVTGGGRSVAGGAAASPDPPDRDVKDRRACGGGMNSCDVLLSLAEHSFGFDVLLLPVPVAASWVFHASCMSSSFSILIPHKHDPAGCFCKGR